MLFQIYIAGDHMVKTKYACVDLMRSHVRREFARQRHMAILLYKVHVADCIEYYRRFCFSNFTQFPAELLLCCISCNRAGRPLL